MQEYALLTFFGVPCRIRLGNERGGKMKSFKIIIRHSWITSGVVLIAVALVCGTVLYAMERYNRTQWDIAQLNAKTVLESSDKASSRYKDGLTAIGSGVCRASQTDSSWGFSRCP